MECQTCNGKGYKRDGFLWLSKEDCPTCHGTGHANWPAHAMRGRGSRVVVDMQKGFLPLDAYSPVPKRFQEQTSNADSGPDLLTTMAVVSIVGGNPLTAAATAEITGSELLGVGAGMLHQDDNPTDQTDDIDRGRGDAVEPSDSTDADNSVGNDTNDMSDSPDSCDCGSTD